jgi:hypothetical protein
MAIAEPFEIDPSLPTGSIQDAHMAYHSLESRKVEPELVANMGRILSRSLDFDHVIDSGWAFMQAGSEMGREDLVIHSVSLLKGVAHHALGTPLEISARMPIAIAPEYRKMAQGEAAEASVVTKRFHALNGRVLALRTVDLKEAFGIAPEVAAIYLLNSHFAKNPDKYPGLVAWPAFPWQDNHSHASHKSNYDMVVGPTPHEGQKVQVKNLLEPSAWKRKGHRADGDELLARWRKKYNSDIAMIFGDVHMGNEANRPFAINQAIADEDRSKNALHIELATRNILNEIGLE